VKRETSLKRREEKRKGVLPLLMKIGGKPGGGGVLISSEESTAQTSAGIRLALTKKEECRELRGVSPCVPWGVRLMRAEIRFCSSKSYKNT